MSLKMPEIDQTDNYPALFNSPALRMSNIVSGRVNIDGRVHYDKVLDPLPSSNNHSAIPEEVILYRWRKREFQSLSFKGFRLSPNIWRSVGMALGSDAKIISKLEADSIRIKYREASKPLSDHNYPSPEASNLKFLFSGMKVNQLQLILDRHLDPDRSDRYGTPDLFLFSVNPSTKEVSIVRFVEVKKPKEPLSTDQAEEITFLRSIGIKARLLRLIER